MTGGVGTGGLGGGGMTGTGGTDAGHVDPSSCAELRGANPTADDGIRPYTLGVVTIIPIRRIAPT